KKDKISSSENSGKISLIFLNKNSLSLLIILVNIYFLFH
ncbi:MAG: hypothetical protein ACI8WA_001654, partial [Polaribacter sp.]